eukprot:m.116704 g.116704  ORF g.116704 m.116704 type:complete len:1052 (+) comp10924_c0_seq1:263-3418(+)
MSLPVPRGDSGVGSEGIPSRMSSSVSALSTDDTWRPTPVTHAHVHTGILAVPSELLSAILAWLTLSELLTASRVCREWHKAAQTALHRLPFVDLTHVQRAPITWQLARLRQTPQAMTVRSAWLDMRLVTTLHEHCPRLTGLDVSLPTAANANEAVLALPTAISNLVALTITEADACGLTPHALALALSRLVHVRRLYLKRGVSFKQELHFVPAVVDPPGPDGAADPAAVPPQPQHDNDNDGDGGGGGGGVADNNAAMGAGLVDPPPPLALSLTHVKLENASLSPNHFQNLLQTCPQLESLALHGVVSYEGRPFEITAATSPSLRSVHLTGLSMVPQVTLTDLPLLSRVDVCACEHLVDMTVHCRRLSHFDIDGCFAVERVNLTSDSLRQLDMTNCVALRSLVADCPNLEVLSLQGCRWLAYEGLDQIIRRRLLPSLRELDVRGTHMLSSEALTALLGPVRPDKGGEGALDTPPPPPAGLSPAAVAALTRGVRVAAQVAGCRVLRAGSTTGRRLNIVGHFLESLHLSELQSVTNICLKAPALVNLDIAQTRRGLELDDVIVECHTLESLTVTNAIRPIHRLSHTIAQLARLTSVNFTNCVLGSIKLKGCSALTTLRIESCQETHEISVTECPRLSEVHLGFSAVRVLTLVQCPSLEKLTVPGCSFDEVCIEAPRLHVIDSLSALWAQPPHYGVLDVHATALTQLSMTRCPGLQDAVLEKILTVSTHLTHLSLFDCGPKLTEVRLPPTLMELQLGSCRGLTRLLGRDGGQPYLPQLTSLSYANVGKLPDVDILAMVQLVAPTLTHLQLSLLGPSVKSLNIEGMPKLTVLAIEYCNALESLVLDCPDLTDLTLAGCIQLASIDLNVPLDRANVRTTPLGGMRRLRLCSHVVPEAAFVAESCPHLNTIVLEELTDVSVDQLQRLVQLVPLLTSVEVRFAASVVNRPVLPTSIPRYEALDPGSNPLTLNFREVKTHRCFPLVLPRDATLDEIKARLSSRTGLAQQSITLIFAGKRILDYSVPLTAFGIQSGSTVNIIAPGIAALSRKDTVAIKVLE